MLSTSEVPAYSAQDASEIGIERGGGARPLVLVRSAPKEEPQPAQRRSPRVHAVDRGALVVLLIVAVLATTWWYYQIASLAYWIIVSTL